jgi:hypothetical protein
MMQGSTADRSTVTEDLTAELEDLAFRIMKIQDRIIVEDETGWRMKLTRVMAIRTKTDDPVLWLKVEDV